MSRTSSIIYRVSKRNDEDFKGGLDYVQALKVWTGGLKFHETWLYGISLVQSKSRPFLLDYKLNCQIELDKIPVSFKVIIENVTYQCDYVPGQPDPANIGEEAIVKITKTRWKLTPDQVTSWLCLYGQIVKPPEYIEAPGVKNIKADTIVCVVKLSKHIPNLLPAYGRRMNVTYSGQPKQCAKCFAIGHFGAQCPNPQKDWLLDYVRTFYEEGRTSMMLGRWFDLFTAATEMSTDN